jgi:hypothetical protein
VIKARNLADIWFNILQIFFGYFAISDSTPDGHGSSFTEWPLICDFFFLQNQCCRIFRWLNLQYYLSTNVLYACIFSTVSCSRIIGFCIRVPSAPWWLSPLEIKSNPVCFSLPRSKEILTVPSQLIVSIQNKCSRAICLQVNSASSYINQYKVCVAQ